MTALKQYQRLESIGLWRADHGDQRREVVVSFGDATLVISDTAGRPLAHWSLPAVRRANPGETPAVFKPGADAPETLEIDDEQMTSAIETVRTTIERARPKPGRLRWALWLGGLASILYLTFVWLPPAIENQTLSVVPQVKRAEIGATVLGHLQAELGSRCQDPAGLEALGAFQQRLLGSAAQIVILPKGMPQAVTLPGGFIVMDNSALDTRDDPRVPAGHVLAAVTARNLSDPMLPLLRFSGLQATVQLLTTGDLPPDTLKAYALHLVENPARYPAVEDMIASFDQAQVELTPFLAAQGITTEAIASGDPRRVLSDQDWVALQGICLGS